MGLELSVFGRVPSSGRSPDFVSVLSSLDWDLELWKWLQIRRTQHPKILTW